MSATVRPPLPGPEADVRVRERPPDRATLALRGAAVVLLLLAALATWPAGVAPTALLIVGVVLLGTLAAVRPGSASSVLAFLFVLWWWAVAEVPLAHWTAFVALTLLVGAHILLTVTALAPASAAPERAVLALWARRGVALAAGGGVVLTSAPVIGGGPVSPIVGAAALVITLTAVLALALAYPVGASESLPSARPGQMKRAGSRKSAS